MTRHSKAFNSKTMKLILCSLVFSAALFHTGLNVLNSLPANPISNSYVDFANNANLGLFRQGWTLFAPEPPTISRSLEYRCQNAKSPEWSSWTDPSTELLETHHQNRFHSAQYVYRFLQSNMREVHNKRIDIGNRLKCKKSDAACVTKFKSEIDSIPEFSSLKKLVAMQCVKDGMEDLKYVQIRSKDIKVTKFSERRKGQVETPIYQLYPIESVL